MRIEDLAPLAITFVVAGITLGIGAEILDEVSKDVTGNVAGEAINNSTAGLGELASWLPTLGLVSAAAMIIGVIFYSFGRVGR